MLTKVHLKCHKHLPTWSHIPEAGYLHQDSRSSATFRTGIHCSVLFTCTGATLCWNSSFTVSVADCDRVTAHSSGIRGQTSNSSQQTEHFTSGGESQDHRTSLGHADTCMVNWGSVVFYSIPRNQEEQPYYPLNKNHQIDTIGIKFIKHLLMNILCQCSHLYQSSTTPLWDHQTSHINLSVNTIQYNTKLPKSYACLWNAGSSGKWSNV
jgi:hypothetical protein